MCFSTFCLPRRCVSCARLGEDLCTDCRAALPLLLGTHCERCGAPTAWPVRRCRECSGRRLAFASARAAVAYEASVPAVVAAWKERGLRRPGRARGGRRRRLPRLPGRRRHSVHPARRRPKRPARPPSRGAPRPRARATLEAAGGSARWAERALPAPARARAAGSPPQRRGRVRCRRAGPEAARARGRRLHHRSDRGGRGVCPAQGRSDPRRRGHLRACRPVNTIDGSTGNGDLGRARCDSR